MEMTERQIQELAKTIAAGYRAGIRHETPARRRERHERTFRTVERVERAFRLMDRVSSRRERLERRQAGEVARV